jgi:hypothetical protein
VKFGNKNSAGRVGSYFWTAFMQLWSNEGMGVEVGVLNGHYPDYEVWVSEE